MVQNLSNIRILSAFGLLVMLSVILPHGVFAEGQEIIIESNGSQSNNEVTLTQESKTEVSQENSMNVTNNVTVDANTGGNETNHNTGDSSIQTGDATVQVNVTNSGNVSVADTSCPCPPQNQGTVTVTGNGAKSHNVVGVTNTNFTNVNISNNANVNNTISGKAVTGQNQANGNLGNVVIKTGSIYAKETIKNGLFNYSYVSAGILTGDYLVKIDGNGAGSKNDIFFQNLYEHNVYQNNLFHVFNESTWDLITGENNANKNVGNVAIITGDIVFESEIVNKGNVNVAEIACCEKPEKPEKPENPPAPPGGNGGKGNGGNGGHGGVNGGISGPVSDILPKTGGLLFFFMIINALFLLFGAFMRLRAGRSPSFSFAV